MRLKNPNVLDWFVELDDKDKESIKAHIEAGWQEASNKRSATKKVESAKAADKAVKETSPATEAGDTIN